jgi:hypothetical protein
MLKRALRARGHAFCGARRRICRYRRTPDHGFADAAVVFVEEDHERSGDRHIMSPHRVPPTAPRETRN